MTITDEKLKCEYCDEPLPPGLNKHQRRIRSHHYENCQARLAGKRVRHVRSIRHEIEAEAVLRFAAKIYVKHKIDVIDYAKQEADDLREQGDKLNG